MKKISFILLLVFLFSLFGAAAASAQVKTRIRIYEASNTEKGTDSSSSEVGELKSFLNFSSYRLLKEETVTLNLQEPVSLPMHTGRTMELLLIKQDGDVAEVRVKLKRDQTDILNTQVRLLPGRTVSIGGPKHGEGVLLITLSARK